MNNKTLPYANKAGNFIQMANSSGIGNTIISLKDGMPIFFNIFLSYECSLDSLSKCKRKHTADVKALCFYLSRSLKCQINSFHSIFIETCTDINF